MISKTKEKSAFLNYISGNTNFSMSIYYIPRKYSIKFS